MKATEYSPGVTKTFLKKLLAKKQRQQKFTTTDFWKVYFSVQVRITEQNVADWKKQNLSIKFGNVDFIRVVWNVKDKYPFFIKNIFFFRHYEENLK